MNKANECTCPSGDGSLVHPCPAHPAVEQAGGDERAACNLWIAEQQLCQGSDISLFKLERNGALVSLHDLLRDAYQAGQARAALAQPSPAPELERPEVVGYRSNETGMVYEQDYGLENPEALTTVAECDRIVGALRDELEAERKRVNIYVNNNRIRQDNERLRAELRDALARVAELERQEPVVRAYGVLPPFAEKVLAKLRRFYDCAEDFESGGVDIGRHWLDLLTQLGLLNRVQRSPALWEISQHGEDLLEAPVAQAQHSVPAYVSYTTQPAESLAGIALRQLKDESRWVEIRDINAHAFPDMRSHSYYPAGTVIKLPAAAPGKEVPQAWIDVQEERRRQITAEGWTPEHDDLYCAAELPRAAAAYILNGANDEAPAIWPFVAKWWKPRDARSNYVRASALILAEIERLDRAAATQGGPSDA
ncbi:hypothetical protein [Pseudomonas aeruginosa]|uniref:hypothetical protein n=1 Tax=Pseudomonas aeruginosa TaxID=287 RepID=UPI00112FF4BA|nr:hypothetical protein [Pseudomonas aeruginosa]